MTNKIDSKHSKTNLKQTKKKKDRNESKPAQNKMKQIETDTYQNDNAETTLNLI